MREPFSAHYRAILRVSTSQNKVRNYADGIRKDGVIQSGRVCRVRRAAGDLPVVAQGEVPARKAFGIDVGVLNMRSRFRADRPWRIKIRPCEG